jgi:hypothetical protein
MCGGRVCLAPPMPHPGAWLWAWCSPGHMRLCFGSASDAKLVDLTGGFVVSDASKDGLSYSAVRTRLRDYRVRD